MRNNKDFGKGKSHDGSSCVSCGAGIDTSAIDSAMESDGNMHHFDKEGEGVSVHYGKSGEHNEAGTHCMGCHDSIQKGGDQEGRREYHEANKDYMRET
jgi:hypothetical protein